MIFLGTGTSQGVPMIGCDCDVCHSPDPRDQRLRSSIYIETPECSWVVDTGTDFRTQVLREDIRRVDAVVFTHSHTDHIMGFDDLRRFSHARGSMPVYASAETMADLERVFRFAFNTSNPVPYYLKPEPTHLSVRQALEVAARVKPEATYFTHICHDLPQSAESRLPAGVNIAYDGLQLCL